MSIEAMREPKTLASVCPELNMANYTEDDVRHLNDWAIEMSLLVEKVAAFQQAQAAQAEVTDGIRPEDFTVDVVVKSMGGFAQINTQGVRVTHKPTGISVTCDVARSQHANRNQAFEKLCTILSQQPDNTACKSVQKRLEAQQPATGEPVAWLDEMLADTREVFDAGGLETPQVVRDVIEYVKSWVTVYSEKNHPAPAAQPAPSVAPSIHEDNARVLQGILEEMHGMLWAPPGANIVRVLRKHIQATKDMYAALEYLSSLHPRRCLLIEVTRAREAIEQYQELFQPSAKEPS